MTQDEVISLMQSSTTKAEWNANCKKVKAAHDGEYPIYWYRVIILSGISDHILTGDTLSQS